MSGLPWPFSDFDSNDTVPPPRVYAQKPCPCCGGRGVIFETPEPTPPTVDDD